MERRKWPAKAPRSPRKPPSKRQNGTESWDGECVYRSWPAPGCERGPQGGVSAHAGSGERVGGPRRVAWQLRHVLQAAVRAEQATDVVGAGIEVVDRERVAEGGLHVVALRLERE